MFTPTMLKVLKYLRDNRVRSSKEEIAAIIDERQDYIDKALEKLVTIGIITEAEGSYFYIADPQGEQFYNSIIEIYHKVNKRPSRELLVRGLICQIPSHYLVHANTLLEILEGYGLEKAELSEFLAQEIENGYLGRIRIICLGMRPFSIPVYVPSYYLSHLRILGWEQYEGMKQDYRNAEFYEEDYLIGHYPAELATPAKEYIDKEGQEIKEKLRQRGIATWLEKFR